jgi:putative DNA primase/helicase
LNDYGNGQRMAIHFGDDLMFVPRVGWFTWGGSHWQKDPDMLAVRALAQQLGPLIQKEIFYLSMSPADAAILEESDSVHEQITAIVAVKDSVRTDAQKGDLVRLREQERAISEVEKRLKDARGRHRSFASTAGNSTRIDNALKEAGVSQAKAFDHLDANSLMVNCANYSLLFHPGGENERADFELVRHRRKDLQTKLMPVDFISDADCPLFEAFLARVQPDMEMRRFLQRGMGLSMTALPMQKLVFLYGNGANGKSVLVDVMARVLGNYSATARIESLTGSNRRGGGDATPDLIPLMGARMVRTSEPDEGQRLQEGLIKELTGGEPLQVRALHSDFVEVRPVFKLTISGNHKPEIRGLDDGIWRRVLLVPFDVQIPEAERDVHLVDKLWTERSGILNWLISGLLECLVDGLNPPKAVIDATKEYREESDPIGQFLTSCCVVTGDPTDVIKSADFGNAFALHMLNCGMTPWKPTTFARQISTKAKVWRHPATGQQFAKSKASTVQYQGIKYTDTFRRLLMDAPKDSSGRPLAPSSDAPNPDTEGGWGG